MNPQSPSQSRSFRGYCVFQFRHARKRDEGEHSKELLPFCVCGGPRILMGTTVGQRHKKHVESRLSMSRYCLAVVYFMSLLSEFLCVSRRFKSLTLKRLLVPDPTGVNFPSLAHRSNCRTLIPSASADLSRLRVVTSGLASNSGLGSRMARGVLAGDDISVNASVDASAVFVLMRRRPSIIQC